jgi:hypothetical protein
VITPALAAVPSPQSIIAVKSETLEFGFASRKLAITPSNLFSESKSPIARSKYFLRSEDRICEGLERSTPLQPSQRAVKFAGASVRLAPEELLIQRIHGNERLPARSRTFNATCNRAAASVPVRSNPISPLIFPCVAGRLSGSLKRP